VKPKFPIGQLVSTPAALEALSQSSQTPQEFVRRHQAGDWGQVSKADGKANDVALIDGSRILSAYKTLKGEKIWIITEADRSSTCILLPSEY